MGLAVGAWEHNRVDILVHERCCDIDLGVRGGELGEQACAQDESAGRRHPVSVVEANVGNVKNGKFDETNGASDRSCWRVATHSHVGCLYSSCCGYLPCHIKRFLPLSSRFSLLSFRIPYPVRLYQHLHFRIRMGMSPTVTSAAQPTEQPIAAIQRL